MHVNFVNFTKRCFVAPEIDQYTAKYTFEFYHRDISVHYCFVFVRDNSMECQTALQEANTRDLRSPANVGVGERVSLHTLSDKGTESRTVHVAATDRKTSENLVPKPSHEVEEREESSYTKQATSPPQQKKEWTNGDVLKQQPVQ